ncbi:MAG: diguanylate cyclase protein [Anaerocolumna sp.]|nr:diguanylate cyclase protein [Anaerocolumna sp.]
MVRNFPKLDNKKKEQIRTMFFTLKILALFFSAIPLFQYFSQSLEINSIYNNNITFAISMILIIFCLLMFFLMFIFNRNENNKILQGLEMVIFLIVFIVSIYVSGANESYNKFIFLFIIISYTIEYDMKTGLIIASISSGVIIAMDFIFGNNNGVNVQFENDIALIAMFYIVSWTLGFYVKLEKSHIQDLIDYANKDGLTGTYNHRYFYENIETLCEDSKKSNTTLSLLMIDLDYFKKYNDMYGHSKGDELLKEITKILRDNIRVKDILCRYGGDEFCIILPDTNKEEAILVANRIREAVCSYDCYGKEHLDHGKMTLSIGVSTFNNETENSKDLIENADLALYRAKFLRRNKVEVYSSIFDQVKDVSDNNTNLLEDIKPLKTLITVINSRDTYTYKHVERVFNYCNIFADYLQMSSEDKRLLLYGAYLHDLGKINVAKEILITNNKLTKEEWEELKKHPQDSADILSQIKGFEKVVPIVLQHHEKYDGTGYPNGLKAENICYLARVLTIVDSFDAMTNQRPYQKTKTFEEAFEEIERCRGTHFDPVLAGKFVEALKSI